MDLELCPEFAVTVHDPGAVEFASGVVRELLGEQGYLNVPNPATASEDFSLVINAVPGAMVMLGTCPPDLDPVEAAGNHSPLARFDDAVLPEAVVLLTGFEAARLAVPE